MATAIQPFLSPEELEVLIDYHIQLADEAAKSGKRDEMEAGQARAFQLMEYRSISG